MKNTLKRLSIVAAAIFSISQAIAQPTSSLSVLEVVHRIHQFRTIVQQGAASSNISALQVTIANLNSVLPKFNELIQGQPASIGALHALDPITDELNHASIDLKKFAIEDPRLRVQAQSILLSVKVDSTL